MSKLILESLNKEKYLTLEGIISLSKQKFGQGFSEKLFLEQLTYWDDIEDYKIEFLKNEVKPEMIKKFLFSEAEKFTSKIFN